MLTSRKASLKMKGKVYRACILSILGMLGKLGYEIGGYGEIGEYGTNDGPVAMWCSLKE